MNMRDEFQKWLLNGKVRKYSPKHVIACMEAISAYSIQKKMTIKTLWDYIDPRDFAPVYNKLLAAKLLRITDRNTYKVFIIAGQLYLRFLKERSCSRRERINTDINGKGNEVKHIQEAKNAIDPEDVIAWLITQPNARGTLYLENVVRQYMGILRLAPEKLDIPVIKDVRNVFACHTPDELNS